MPVARRRIAVLNIVVLIGRLTADPELRYTQAGNAVATFNLAVDRPFQSAQGESETDFIPIVVWGKSAEACANYLAKGRLCAVAGRIQVRSWEDQQGQRRYRTEVVANNVRFLEWGDRAQGQEKPPPEHNDNDLPF
jgi:single-strand DNA-binding protein